MHTKSMDWTPDDIPDLQGKQILITGANSGIGLEAARHLARRRPHLLLACRNLDKGQAAVESVREAGPEATVELVALDLADLSSVRAAAEKVSARVDRLDVLINNAGVMALPERRTADGFEMQLGTNHLGHFALTGLLLPRLLASEAGRVVTVSSGMHKVGEIDFDDLNWEQRKYDRWRAYGQSKLANLLFCYELQRRLESAHPNVISLACHPGYASTHLQTAGAEMSGNTLVEGVMKLGNSLIAQSAESGALPTVYAATAPGLEGGEYVGPGIFRLWGRPTKQRSSRRSRDVAVAQRLWAVSEELTGVSYLS
jgi:NAD(P)-dependent dehydrogenase (short-subunit alcohol dehydrogenase family)